MQSLKLTDLSEGPSHREIPIFFLTGFWRSMAEMNVGEQDRNYSLQGR